ncbi:MAG: hypothetical protein ACRDK4_14935 [Solirubrobacteraceae bacterium]
MPTAFALDALSLGYGLFEKVFDERVPPSFLQVVERNLGGGTHDLPTLALIDNRYEYGSHIFVPY